MRSRVRRGTCGRKMYSQTAVLLNENHSKIETARDWRGVIYGFQDASISRALRGPRAPLRGRHINCGSEASSALLVDKVKGFSWLIIHFMEKTIEAACLPHKRKNTCSVPIISARASLLSAPVRQPIAQKNRSEAKGDRTHLPLWARLLAEQKEGASLGGVAVRLQCTTLRRRVLTTPT